jgi:hypothetical protein
LSYLTVATATWQHWMLSSRQTADDMTETQYTPS